LKNLSISQVESELKYLKLRHGGKSFDADSIKTINTNPEKSRLANKRKKKPFNNVQSKAPSLSKVAIIVPYRNRTVNLNLFLLYLHQFLNKQNLNYGIYLIEPLSYLKFNRALLINIGFVESLKDEDYDCFIFHDVDMLPERSSNIYECNTEMPKQMAIAINTYSYS
jgi:hypothetical protein